MKSPEELREAYLAADFFNREVVDLNKEKITVTDVGTTTLSLKRGDQERTVSYGYADGDPFREIIVLTNRKFNFPVEALLRSR